jgi:hypothetical protein
VVLDNTSESDIVNSFVVNSGLLDKTPAVVADAELASDVVESVKLSVCVDVIISTLVVATVDIKGSLVDLSSTVV